MFKYHKFYYCLFQLILVFISITGIKHGIKCMSAKSTISTASHGINNTHGDYRIQLSMNYLQLHPYVYSNHKFCIIPHQRLLPKNISLILVLFIVVFFLLFSCLISINLTCIGLLSSLLMIKNYFHIHSQNNHYFT